MMLIIIGMLIWLYARNLDRDWLGVVLGFTTFCAAIVQFTSMGWGFFISFFVGVVATIAAMFIATLIGEAKDSSGDAKGATGKQKKKKAPPEPPAEAMAALTDEVVEIMDLICAAHTAIVLSNSDYDGVINLNAVWRGGGYEARNYACTISIFGGGDLRHYSASAVARRSDPDTYHALDTLLQRYGGTATLGGGSGANFEIYTKNQVVTHADNQGHIFAAVCKGIEQRCPGIYVSGGLLYDKKGYRYRSWSDK